MPGPPDTARAQPRVLMVLKRPAGRAGMQMQAARVGRCLARQGVPVTFACGGGPAGAARLGLPFHRLTGHFPSALLRLLLARSADYDVVHVHGFGWEAAAASLARRRTGRPLVVKASTAGPGTTLHRAGRARGALRPLVEPVDAWVALSAAARADLLRLGVAEGRIALIPNGVDPAEFAPAPAPHREALRRRAGLPPGGLAVCTIARLTAHKRVHALLRAFLSLAADHPGLRLWVVGDGEEGASLRRQAEVYEHGDRVTWLGSVPEECVREVLQAADVFVLPSRWEGLSNALLEAMACGVPPLATAVSGTTDVVTHERDGLLMALDDDGALRAGLERLLSDGPLRARLGAAARECVVARYSLEGTAAALLALYCGCLDAREDPAP